MKIISIDFDNTLYSNNEIINKDKINKLFENPNNFIVIFTARSYSQYHFIRELLNSNYVKFHAIVCEKIRADAYVDDKNVGGLLWL